MNKYAWGVLYRSSPSASDCLQWLWRALLMLTVTDLWILFSAYTQRQSQGMTGQKSTWVQMSSGQKGSPSEFRPGTCVSGRTGEHSCLYKIRSMPSVSMWPSRKIQAGKPGRNKAMPGKDWCQDQGNFPSCLSKNNQIFFEKCNACVSPPLIFFFRNHFCLLSH